MSKESGPSAAPPGWSYNPSAWSQRLPIVVLAAVGFFIAGYMSLFQFNILETVWDPVFGSASSRKILTSPVSNLLPIPDAALGALGYLLDAVTGIIGGKRRWRTMPWIVILFGLAVGPLGAISIALVIIQPVVFNAWCFLCLVTAVISIVMIGPALDETLASMQYLRRIHDAGGSWWGAFIGRPGLAVADALIKAPAPPGVSRVRASRQMARQVAHEEREEAEPRSPGND